MLGIQNDKKKSKTQKPFSPQKMVAVSTLVKGEEEKKNPKKYKKYGTQTIVRHKRA